MSLLSSHKTSDSGLVINLHPLVLLTISDYITRHTLRRQTQPVVGALLGQLSGRSISLEQAYDVQVVQSDNGQWVLHDAFFKDRLQQYKDVHQAPALELVGWFTTSSATGPEAHLASIHEHLLQNYNETAVLLTLHPASIPGGQTAGGKLPLTIYESVYESTGDGDHSMETGEKEGGLELRFRELPYSIETGEAEMIGIDSVARGGGNATASDSSAKKEKKPDANQSSEGKAAEKGVKGKKEQEVLEDSSLLSAEDEELISSLTARANAIKMLHTRIKLIKDYLTSMPPSYLTTSSDTSKGQLESEAEIDYPLLRSIKSLVSRLPLLLPSSDFSSFKHETLAEKSDVELVSLLGCLGRSVKDARELGRKFALIEEGRKSAKKLDLGYGRLNELGSDEGPENGGLRSGNAMSISSMLKD
ncbi:uncharacterized protein KY384_000441 [Bacidia gigantensis]|uniref:uncharacterized protein n=1 Tax=Bacidia gigantensis TaxID=2732470 RepID=UPI001D039514|nr:uncharacterized protein KY384_000441 [Bacidia gigantensis]KAG8525681.1 hypothetical protein KY384_000441 [Bacidia gigantensis]